MDLRLFRLCGIAAIAALVSGCTSLQSYLLERRLGLTAAAPLQTVAPPGQRDLGEQLAAGAQALAGTDLDRALAAFRRYAAIAPTHLAQARKVRGWLTLLERESARRFAAQAVALERAGRFGPRDPRQVAVFPLRSLGPNAARDPFNRAVLAMITTDLAQVPSLVVLERERVDALLRELDLAASGLVDGAAGARPARLLGAGSVVAGSVFNEPGPTGPGSGRYAIATSVTDVGSGRMLGTAEAAGQQDDFFRLQKQVVHGILDALGVKDIPSAVDRVHTLSWAAYARFAAGLSLLAENRFDEARQAFRAALGFDPGFALAEQAFLATPEQPASLDQIAAEARAGR